MTKILGIDVGGTDIKFGVYDEKGCKLSFDSIKTPQNYVDFQTVILEICNRFPEVEGVGISIPGFVHSNIGYIEFGGALRFLDEKYFAKIIMDEINKPVYLENDANCVALAEKWIGNGVEFKNFFCLTVGTGIGGGIVINDALYRGNSFRAGEFGFTIVEGHNPGQSIEETILSNVAAVRPLTYEVKDKLGLDLNGKQIFEQKATNKDMQEIYSKWIMRLAIGVYNHIYSLNPEAVLIGGAISANEEFMKDLNDSILKVHPGTLDYTKVLPCKFLNESGVVGAIYNYLSEREQ